MINPSDITPEQALDAYQEMYENFKSTEEAFTRMEGFNLDLKKKLQRLTIELEREKRNSEHWCNRYNEERNAYEKYRNGVAKHLAKYASISNEEKMDEGA